MAKARNRSLGQNQGNQQAPGRDLRQQSYEDQPGQADVNAAIGGGIPAGNAAFQGAKETINAQDSQPGDPAYTPPQSQAPPQAPMNPAGNMPGANGNTGIAGGMANPMAAPQQPQGPVPVPGQGKLWGTLDQNKLNDPAHAEKSAKYELLQLAKAKGYTDPEHIALLLNDLKAGPNAQRWAGWEQVAPGSDHLEYRGQGPLAEVFKGLNKLDVYHDMEGKGGFGFQDDTPQAHAAMAAAQGGGRPFRNFLQTPTAAAILGQAPQAVPGQDPYSTSLRESIAKALANPQLAALFNGQG
jgi:hypothetical protein